MPSDAPSDDRENGFEVRRRDDGSWDLVRRDDSEEVVSNHPLESMAVSECYRRAQQESQPAREPGGEADEADEADEDPAGPYPDNVGG